MVGRIFSSQVYPKKPIDEKRIGSLLLFGSILTHVGHLGMFFCSMYITPSLKRLNLNEGAPNTVSIVTYIISSWVATKKNT